jgi:L-lactate dehydrogenase
MDKRFNVAKHPVNASSKLIERALHQASGGDHANRRRRYVGFCWSTARIAGVPVVSLLHDRGEDIGQLRAQIESEVRYANITIIKGHNASQYGIGVVSARIAEMTLHDGAEHDSNRSYQQDLDVTLSLSSIVGGSGIMRVLQPELSDEERKGLETSAEKLRNALKCVG